MGVVFYDDAFEAALEKMTALRIQQIEPSRIGGAEPLHSFGKVCFGRLQQKMVMVSHQHVRVYVDIEALGKIFKQV